VIPLSEPDAVVSHLAEDVGRLPVTSESSSEQVVAAVRKWIDEEVPPAWIEAGRSGGAAAVREVRSRADYEAWYPVFGRSGLVAATWPVSTADWIWRRRVARRADEELAPVQSRDGSIPSG
jgi:hypothetical protein